MLLSVYGSNKIKKTVLSPEDSSTQVKVIQGDNVLTLSFTLYEYVPLEVNDYIDYMGERYWLTECYQPHEVSTQEWAYDVKFYGLESLVKRFLVLNTTDGDADPAFTLTAPPLEHVALIVQSINDGFGTTDWKVGQVDGSDNIVIDYEGKYCDVGLKEIASKTGAEWWFDGTTVNVCRCEYGEEITLGYNKGLTELERDTADNVKLYTRLFPVGSSRNIDASVYGHGRLQLPGGVRYVDVNTDKYGIIHHFEKDAFADIYPRRIGTVSSVRNEEVKDEDGNPYTIYYFQDSGLDFDPNSYEIGLVKHVSFQEGSELAGLGNGDEHYFEVNYNSETKEFEIITIWPYDDGTQLPGATLVPKTGDKYILWNIRMPNEYYPAAEQELKDAVDKYNAKHGIDVSVYKAPTDHVHIEENGIDLFIGRRVKLESSEYFPGTGYRSSRVTKISRRVNLPSQMDLDISDALSTGALEQIGDEITDVKNYIRNSSASQISVVRSWEDTPASDYNVASYKMTLKQIALRALSRLTPDEAKGLIKFLAGSEFGKFKEGLSGGSINKEGNAELGKLITRLRAILAELQVNGAAEFRGNLSSEEFVSGFLDGKGWSIFKKEVLNALGVPETKYVGEFDEIVVRGVLRVFTMVISQLLGENDNRVFSGMMEVDHYDPATGKVYLNTQNGKLYNPFRKDDYIMVQQYNGLPSQENDHYINKHYELIITNASIGNQSEGENRLDWVTFSNFMSADGRPATDVITRNDTFTRVDNATDADRKGIIQIITVGTATPYMDIVYGLKTDPDNSLKGRMGNLKGIHHHLFGWLQGFGELLTNLYAVGDIRLRRTGESLDAKIEMLKAMFATQYQRVTYELTEEDNYLKNATFSESLSGWLSENEASILMQNGEVMMMNGSTFATSGKRASIEEYEGRNMLHLHDSYVKQGNADIRKPGTHKEYKQPTPNNMTEEYIEVKDTLYLSVKFLARTAGTLTIGIQGASSEPDSLPFSTVAVTGSMDWQILQWSGTWDGQGDFLLRYTGDMYVSLLSLTDKALTDFKKEVSTKIEQTDTNIRLLGTNINNLKGTVTQLGIDLDAAEERISIYAKKTDTLENTVTNLGVRLDAAESNITLYATKVGNNEASISALQVKTDSIRSAVTSVEGDLETAKARIEAVKAIAEAASDAETYNQSNNPWNSWPGGTEYKHVGAVWYNTSDGHTYRYIGYNNTNTWEDITNVQSSASYVLQNKDKISTVVANFDASGKPTSASGLVTTAYASQIYATKTTVDNVSGRVSTAEANISIHSTQISLRVEKDGIISAINQSSESVAIDAKKINLNGVTTINNSFRVDVDGTTRIGGFVVSGRGLTNRNEYNQFVDDAYIIIRNDDHKAFAGIGGNTLPASMGGARAVARFQNHDDSDWFGIGFETNYAVIASARGAATNNVALQIEGGCISGMAYKTECIGLDNVVQTTAPASKYVTLGKYTGSLYVSTQFYWKSKSSDTSYQARTRDIYITLPEMQVYDDGHTIKIKRGVNNSNYVYLSPGRSHWKELTGTGIYDTDWTERTGTSYILYDNANYGTSSSKLRIDSEGDAMELVYHRDLIVTINGVSYHGCWVQYKHPRAW